MGNMKKSSLNIFYLSQHYKPYLRSITYNENLIQVMDTSQIELQNLAKYDLIYN